MTFGGWLRREIERRLWSQARAAQQFSLSREHLNRILFDQHTPVGTTVEKISRGLGVDRAEVESHLPSSALAASA